MPFSLRKLTKVSFLAFLALRGVVLSGLTYTTHYFKARSQPGQQRLAQASAAATPANDYEQRHRLRWDLRDRFERLGDRISKPGKERLSWTSIVTRSTTKAEVVAVRLITELPDKVRLEELKGDKAGVTTFDGTTLRSSRKVLDKSDENEIESLVYMMLPEN